MALKHRLIKLESAMSKPIPIRIARFVMPENRALLGYACGDITIIREQGESVEALHKRCFESVTWPDFPHRNIFKPLEDVCH
jgi:hypothetical protein